ncbi:MAG: GTPase HflX, partial [Lachnospiraceae bacterium]|nr:GTPase HflX [Lachnospiraceae bacterium]
VELAELKYRMTRLKGSGEAMSRLGGGIGTRGPGESKLDTDRRRIRDRISSLKQALDDVVRHRDLTRRTRSESGIPVVAFIGYTNAGKSTLLNTVAGADVLSEDKLFATRDPTTRSACLPGGETVLFTDTVGFINKLPHHLVDAFRSTLEEAKFADVIALVADASDPNLEKETAVVYETMDMLKIAGKPVITVYNKWDRIGEGPVSAKFPVRDPKAVETVRISALTGEGIDDFLKAVERVLLAEKREISAVIPFSDGWKIAKIRERGTMMSESYEADGIHVHCRLPKSLAGQLFGEGNIQ